MTCCFGGLELISMSERVLLFNLFVKCTFLLCFVMMRMFGFLSDQALFFLRLHMTAEPIFCFVF
eukprot:m.384412 g.384412  ORF g.384412 m.384412 type:complete len:64 (-) comp132234_c0_seq1:23-214(-)